ncbi:MAG: hypothetical protein WC780_12170 [Lentimicrobiaceae bacterium]|jgi:hypothetical protein
MNREKAFRILRFVALFLGLQASVLFTVFLITEAGTDLLEGKTRVIPILLIMISAVAGFVWTVTRPVRGSFVMITVGLVMTIYLLLLGGIGEIQMALIYGLPFIFPGAILYYISKREIRKRVSV